MLAAEALRLAAVETLCPHAALVADANYPTLARHRVIDSRAVAVEDLDRSQSYTPVLALYTPDSGSRLRGPLTDASDTEADATLDIIGELAVSDHDADGEFAAAMAETDPKARLVLAAMMSQARYVLSHSQKGFVFRRICKQVLNTEYQTFAVPQLGLRLHRITMRMHCEIRDDNFEVDAGELPEPMRSLYRNLSDGSYAKAKLTELAAAFAPDLLPALDSVHATSGAVTHGLRPGD
jgi:hypothetical protein